MSAILRDLGEGPDSPAKAMARDAWRQGWVKKRPTSHKDKPFKQSAVVKRFFDTHGFQVAYYDRAPIGKNSGVRPKGWFDLRVRRSPQPALCVRRRPARPVPKLTILASGRGRR